MNTELTSPETDDLLAGIRAAREQHAASHRYDLHAICNEARREEQKLAAEGWRVVNLLKTPEPSASLPA